MAIPISKTTTNYKISGTNYVCIKEYPDDSWQAIPPRLMEDKCRIYGKYSTLSEKECSDLVSIADIYRHQRIYTDYQNDDSVINSNGISSLIVGYIFAKESLKSLLVAEKIWNDEEDFLIVIPEGH